MNVLKLKYLWLILPFLAMGCEDDGSANADRLALSHDTYGFPVGGGEFTVLVSSTVKYSVTSEGDWLVMTGQEGDRYSYKADENTSYNMREALVIVKAQNNSLVDTVHVYQVGKDGLFLDEAERAKTIGLEGGSVEVNLNFTNMGFRVKPMVDWITYVPTKALQQAKITLQVVANTEYDSRTGKVVIVSKDGLFSDTVTVTQSQKLGIVLDKKSVTAVSEGEVLKIYYKRNVDKASAVIPSEYQTWVSEVPEVKSLSRDSLYLKIEENESQDERIAIIPIKCEEYTDTLTITQKGAVIAKNTDGTYTVFSGATLEDVLAKAKEGDVFKFMTGTYGTANTKYNLPIGVTFEAVADEKPLMNIGQFSLTMTANVGNIKLKGIKINCGGYVFDHNVAGNVESIELENCDFVNCKAVAAVLRIRLQAAGVKNITIDNCTFDAFDNVKQHVISGDNGFPVNVTITNSTFAKIKAGSIVNYGKQALNGVSVIITNNTFAALETSGSHYILRPEKDFTNGTVKIEKNIFNVVAGYKGINSSKIKGSSVSVADNCVPTDFISDWSGDTGTITDDPQFKDAANGDFTVQSATVKAAAVGDPRWLK